MEIQEVKINSVKLNPNNPRTIKDDKFKKLVQSIKDFPKMFQIRPIVVNDEMVILGGNMRYKAAKEAGLKTIPIIKASELTEDEQNEFIIKDNVGFGEFDWELIKTEWDETKLENWGLDVLFKSDDINLQDFFNEDNSEIKENKFKIVLEYSEQDYNLIQKAFEKYSGSKENIIFNLLVK